jgi:hypothetical protein
VKQGVGPLVAEGLDHGGQYTAYRYAINLYEPDCPKAAPLAISPQSDPEGGNVR